MPRCPSCREWLPSDPVMTQARCPHCRQPLYVDDDRARRRGDPDSPCPVHPDSPGLGTCQRCGNYLCAVCRTRIHRRVLCAACAARALERTDAEESGPQLRAALAALILGIVSWGIFLGAIILATVGVTSKQVLLLGLAGLLLMGSPLPAVIGVGQALAVLRVRRSHMILATMGLVLCGLNVGMMLGMILFSLSRN